MPYKDPEKQRTAQARYRAKNRDKCTADMRRWRAAHPERARANDRAWKQKNREKINAQARARYAANPEVACSRARAWRAANPEKARTRDAKYREKYREQRILNWQQWYLLNKVIRCQKKRLQYAAAALFFRAGARAWRAANPEKARKADRAWKQAHPEQAREHSRRRRARKQAVQVNDLSAAQWLEIQGVYDHRCSYCGKRQKGKLTQDHISALGPAGSHTLHNVVPACRSCNSKKGRGAPLVPVQPLLLTIAPPKAN